MRRALALLGLAVAGCLPELVQIEGEHLLYEHSAEYEVCGGTVDYMDRLIPWLAEHAGLPTPEQLRFSWITRAELKRLLGVVGRRISEKGGVAIGDHAISNDDPVLFHELIHNLWGEVWSAPFLVEGFATAYEALIVGVPVRYDTGWPSDVWEETDAVYDDRGIDYATAGVFVMFLLARHGPEKFARYYRSIRRPYTRGELAAEFREIYGLELGDEIDHFQAGDLACDDYGHDLLAVRCFGPEIPWTEGIWNFAGILACEGADVIGGTMPQGSVPSFRVVTVEVPQDGDYEVLLYGDSGVNAQLLPCFGCPMEWDYVSLELNLADTRAFKAGRYQVRVETRSESAPTFGVVLRPVSSP